MKRPDQTKSDFIRQSSACTGNQIATLSPFNKLLLTNAMNFYGLDVPMEKRLLIDGNLTKSIELTQGNLLTVWNHQDSPDQTLEYKITWNRSRGMMPTLLETRSIAGVKFEERVAVDWRLQQKHWVPTNIRSQAKFATGRQISYFVKLDWRFGKQLKKEQLDRVFDLSNDDYRLSVAELFGVVVSTPSDPGTPFIVPDDLYTGANPPQP